MIPLWRWEIPFIAWLQQGHPVLTPFFLVVTNVGGTPGMVLLGLLLYWCIDRHSGSELFLTLGAIQSLNLWLKTFFRSPRPFRYSTRIRNFSNGHGFGFPSGHTVNAVVLWLYLALQLRRGWFWIAGGLFALAVALSRVYLGVHFVIDILGGFAVGLLGLFLYLGVGRYLPSHLPESLVFQAALLLLLGFLATLFRPADVDFVLATTGLTWGALGMLLERHFVGFNTTGSWQRRALRLPVGILGGFILWWSTTLLADLAPPLPDTLSFLDLS
ncbi:MAG: phosphatase PAP2 family protein, partial [Anaerolineae bacterium]